MTDRIELDGLQFAVSFEPDHDSGPSWKEECGPSPVSAWRQENYSGHIPTAPGERVLYRDRCSALVYDTRGATQIALRDGWGLTEKGLADLARRLRREPTRGEIAAEAVAADYQRLRRWCEGDWSYIGVVVTLLDVDGHETEETESLWGIESDAGDYLDEVALELAAEIAGRVGGAKTLTKTTRIRG